MGSSSTNTMTRTIYGNTTTKNPYVTSKTTNSGTNSSFNTGSAFDTINNFVNKNMDSLLEQYLNPTLNSVTNKSKMNSYIDALNSESSRYLENNIINPLSNRNMIRSSQATNLYNNMLKNNTNSIANYANQLLSGSQKETASMLGTLLAAYLDGYNILSDAQNHSLSSSQGNAVKSQSSSNASATDMGRLTNLATMMALSTL